MLIDAIAARLATWDTPPYVELAAFGTADPAAIAGIIDDACERALGARVAAARFYHSSIGAVAGVELADGHAIVVKVHQPSVAIETLHELARVRAIVPYSPRVLGVPLAIGRGAHATFEELVTGDAADVREPVIRAALAASLHAIVRAARPLVASSALAPTMVWQPVWGTPHSELFDFAATAAGAEWIDDVARAACARATPAGERVIAHCDWRIEHVRFAGVEPVVGYDWDSLRCDHEPAIVGWLAHAFAADWSTDRAPAPTLDEARAFVAAYEAARGREFDAIERRLCGAAFAYGCAYTARCGHALAVDRTAPPFGGADGRAQVPAVDGTAPPFGGADGRAQVPAVDRTAPPFGGTDGRAQVPAVDRTAPPFGGADGRAQVPAVDRTAPPFGGAAGRAQVPAVDERDVPGTFQELVARHGTRLMTL